MATAPISENELVYDWNTQGDRTPPPMRAVDYHDETLRDGIQCPSVQDPSLDDKLRILRLLSAVGVHTADVGLPGAGERAVHDVTVMAEMVRDEKLSIQLTCAGRTHPRDIEPILEISAKTGVPIEVMAFLGTSPIRLYAEDWDEDLLEKRTRAAAKLTVDAGQVFNFVTEDTVRSHPRLLGRLFRAALEEGAQRLTLCDTVGHATPDGVFNLVHFTKNILRAGDFNAKLDWHGHNDRGHAVPNTLNAIEAGVDRVHGTILGVGERVGNTSLDQVLVNLALLGAHDGDLTPMAELVELVSQACGVPIPVSYPVFGKDAFRTGTGVHAAAIVKAMKRGDDYLADRIYSGVPASWFGLKQGIEVGHYSGMSNVHAWLVSRGLPVDELLSKQNFDAAKATNRLLEEHEIQAIVNAWQAAQP